MVEQLVRLHSGEWLRKEPKTPASIRSITISGVTADVLGEHLERFAAAGVDGLVFRNAAGKPIAASSFWNNHFARALRKTQLACRFHDLRHTSVALAIAAGAHPKAIQARMGHSSINVTLDRYGHPLPRARRSDRSCLYRGSCSGAAHAGNVERCARDFLGAVQAGGRSRICGRDSSPKHVGRRHVGGLVVGLGQDPAAAAATSARRWPAASASVRASASRAAVRPLGGGRGGTTGRANS